MYTTQLSLLKSTQQNKFDYQNVSGDIPIDLPQGAYISVKRNTPLKIYNIGFQPVKTIPEIPRWFLQRYGNYPFTILEPFSGSGTMILESIRFGSPVYWLDNNPLSRLICQVKTSYFSPDVVSNEISNILNMATNQKHAPTTIKFKNKDFWFQKPVQEGLEILREHIVKSKPDIQPVLWLAFSLTVRKTSNMNDGMILAARRPHIEKIPNRSRHDVFSYFKKYVEEVTHAINEWQNNIGNMLENVVELDTHDARRLNGDWTCEAVITSPPYINAIDYVWAAKFELHWLDMVKNDKERLNLYSQEIGTERIPSCEYKKLGQTDHAELDKLIEDIYTAQAYKASKGQNQLRARVVYQYFMDMKKHFSETYKKLKEGGYYCFSIGDFSRICGVKIPVASILTDFACQTGFEKLFHFHLLLKNRRLNIPRNVNWADTIKHDTIVVLEKPK